MSTWLFIDCFLLILIIWWIYDLLKGEFLINKLGAKASFGWLIGNLITTIIVIIIKIKRRLSHGEKSTL